MMGQLVIALEEGLHCILPDQIVDDDGIDLDFGSLINFVDQ